MIHSPGNSWHTIVWMVLLGFKSVCLTMHEAVADEIEPGTYVANLPVRAGENTLYVSNRAPLLPNPLIKLPIGSIKPKGWLLHQLELMRDGMTGHLPELSQWCRPENNGWLDPNEEGWEELPYWLNGFGDLGYVLKDERIINEAKKWLDAAMASQDADGYFGPRVLKANRDLWPNMIMLNAFESRYEATGDERVIPFMTKYFRYQMSLPDEHLLNATGEPEWHRPWGKMRAGDNLESVYWLYNRTGERWLLDLATRIHERTADWTSGLQSWHGPNLAQCFREPAEYYQQAHDSKFLLATERNYSTFMGTFAQVPGGMFGADENCRPGYTGPEQGAETCAMIEFMHSFEMLLTITGDSVYADRCEDVAFNSFPAAQTPDLKGLHYLTAPNLVRLDHRNHSPNIQNRGCMFAYSPGERYRCCQHNVAQGWPSFAEHLWFATRGNGIAALFYGPCEVDVIVGDNVKVSVVEETDYPFSGTVRCVVSPAKPVRVPLSFRIPGWCRDARVSVNGEPQQVAPTPLSYVVIDRIWNDKDEVRLELPMNISLRVWHTNKNSVSVDRGPLTYSLKIGEQWVKSGGTDEWPEYDVLPTTPWNYGLVLNEKDPTSSFTVIEKPLRAAQPFTLEDAPVELHAKGKRIPNWVETKGFVGRLPESPLNSNEPVEHITLVPMGCARLRISAFPTVSQ